MSRENTHPAPTGTGTDTGTGTETATEAAAARGANVRLRAVEIARLLGRPEPTPEQVAVIEAPLEPALVVAGAGSGKTETMSARVVWLVANGLVEPRHILGLTFTRKAAAELHERITERLGGLTTAMREADIPLPPALRDAPTALVGQQVLVHTYNGFSLDVVKEHALRVGVDPDAAVLTPAAAWQLAYDIVDTWPGPLPFSQSSASVASAIVSLSGSLADHLVGPADLDEHLRQIEAGTQDLPLQGEGGRRRQPPAEVKKLWERLDQRRALVPMLEAFAERKRQMGAIDFADQVSLAARIAATSPDAVDLVRSHYQVVLLDEFQDTSVAQLVLLEHLFGGGHVTSAVGDPNQAIYGWRGASAGSLSTFLRAFAGPSTPVRQFTLSTSWRNDQLILDVANRIGERLADAAHGVELPRLTSRPGAGPGEVQIVRYADARAEAAGIAQWIAGEQERAREAAEGLVDAPLPSAAILMRTRSQLGLLTEALEARGLAYHVVGGGGLLHESEVADVRALLEVADSSDRGDSLMRLLEGPRFHLGQRDIAVLGQWRSQLQRLNPRAREREDTEALVGLADAIESPPPPTYVDSSGRSLSEVGRARIADLRACLRAVRSHSALELPDLVAFAARVLGVDVAVRADIGRQESRALANLEELRSHAAAYAANVPHAGLSAFLAFLDITIEREAGLAAVDSAEVPDGAVLISTMHAAKGLEWDIVAIASLSDGTFPSYTRRSAVVPEDGGEALPRESGWLADVALASIPTELRGDADILEDLRWAEAETLVDLEALLDEARLANGAEKLREETRLMYVAATRARARLHLSWAPWRLSSATAGIASRFLTGIASLPGVESIEVGEVPEENPLQSSPPTAPWPTPANPRERVVAEARRAVSALRKAGAAEVPEAGAPLALATRHVIAAHRAGAAEREVQLPLRLSPSDLVALDGDDTQRLLDIVRPMPRRPSPHAALGTRFHSWLEASTSAPSLVDIDEFDLVADADEAGDSSLAELRDKFERSPFASMTPIAVEHPVALTLSGAYMPGIIDAVYEDPEDPDGVWIVDWKTGRVPHGAELERKALQLSVYRLAWQQSMGTPLEKIRTMFHYVAAERTVEITRHTPVEELEAMLAGLGTEPGSSGAI